MRRKALTVRSERGFKRVVKYVRVTKKIVTAGPFYEQFGAAVRFARERQELKQAELGEKVGLTRTSIVNIEQGRQRVMLDDLVKFAKALKMEPRELFAATMRGAR